MLLHCQRNALNGDEFLELLRAQSAGKAKIPIRHLQICSWSDLFQSNSFKHSQIKQANYLQREDNVDWCKYFFQLDYQVDMSPHLTEALALRHSKELFGMKPS